MYVSAKSYVRFSVCGPCVLERKSVLVPVHVLVVTSVHVMLVPVVEVLLLVFVVLVFLVLVVAVLSCLVIGTDTVMSVSAIVEFDFSAV